VISLCMEREQFISIQNTREMVQLTMLIPIIILLESGMIELWLSLSQLKVLAILQSVNKVVIMTEIYIHARFMFIASNR